MCTQGHLHLASALGLESLRQRTSVAVTMMQNGREGNVLRWTTPVWLVHVTLDPGGPQGSLNCVSTVHLQSQQGLLFKSNLTEHGKAALGHPQRPCCGRLCLWDAEMVLFCLALPFG